MKRTKQKRQFNIYNMPYGFVEQKTTYVKSGSIGLVKIGSGFLIYENLRSLLESLFIGSKKKMSQFTVYNFSELIRVLNKIIQMDVITL